MLYVFKSTITSSNQVIQLISGQTRTHILPLLPVHGGLPRRGPVHDAYRGGRPHQPRQAEDGPRHPQRHPALPLSQRRRHAQRRGRPHLVRGRRLVGLAFIDYDRIKADMPLNVQ